MIKELNSNMREEGGDICEALDSSFKNFKRRNGNRTPSYFRKELHSEPFYRVIFAPQLIRRVKQILKTEEIRLYPVYMLRGQEQNEKVVEWHQDPVYTQFLNPLSEKKSMKEYLKSTLNVWVPLCDVSINQAPLRVAIGSHKYGIVPHYDISDKNISSAPVFSLRDPWFSRYAWKQESLPVRAGSAIFFNHTLAHTSTPNRNHRIRWSLDLRFESALQNSFRKSPGFSSQISLKSWMDADTVPPLSDLRQRRKRHENCYSSDANPGMLLWEERFECNEQIHNCIRPANFDKIESRLILSCKNGEVLKTFNQSSLSQCFTDYGHKPSILFAGESVTRGIFEDFLRILHNSMRYRISTGGVEEIVQIAKTDSVDAYFTFMTGTFGESIHESKKEGYKKLQKRKYVYSFTNLRNVYEKIGAVDVTIIGAAALDILMINDLKYFRYEMKKIIKLAMRYSSKIVLRTETPIVRPTLRVGESFLHYLEYNTSLKEYNRVTWELAKEFGLMVLDAYNIISSGIRLGAIKHGLMEDYGACLQKISETNAGSNQSQEFSDIKGKISNERLSKKKYKKNEVPYECTNQHHISCTTCDNAYHSGMGSMAIAQALGSLLCV